MTKKSVLVLAVVLILQAAVTAAIVVALSAPAEVSQASRPNRLFATSASLGIVEIDPASGAVLHAFAAPENLGTADGLAFDGTTLYYLSGSWDSNTLYALDPDSGTVVVSYTLPASAFRNGLAALNGKVYILDYSVLTQDISIFDPVSGSIVGSLDIDGTNPGAPRIGGGLAGIREPDALLVTTSEPGGPYELLEIDAATGQITGRFEHGLGSGVAGVGVLNGQIYLGRNTGGSLSVYDRDGTLRRTLAVPGSIGFQSLGGDDGALAIDVQKSSIPQGVVDRGGTLTYTLHLSSTPGARLGLYDPLSGTTFAGFVGPVPAGVVHAGGAITGVLTVTASSRLSLTFVVEVSAGAAASVTNRACAYAWPGTLERCAWSAAVSHTIRQAPETPVLLSPPDGAVTTTQAVTLAWQPAGGWPADGYTLDLDGTVVTTTATTWPVVLDVGLHTWAVRAFNGAGSSAWAGPWRLEVRRFRAYLPLVLRGAP